VTGEDYRGAYNGTYRATIVHRPAGEGGVWVRCSRLNGQTKMPAQTCVTITYPDDVGAVVIVATIAGRKDDLVIVGRIR